MGTPWTAHDSSIPAFTNVYTPDPNGRYLGSPGISPLQGPEASSSPRQAVVITGADITIQPVGQHTAFEQDVQAPAQEGPLTYYPSYSVIDSRRKWQRIRDWASKDSATATGATSGGSSIGGAATPAATGPSINAGEADVSASIDSTLMELEFERARASANLKAAAAAGGPGGVSSIAAAIAAAASAAKAAGGPSTTSLSAGGTLGLTRPGHSHHMDLAGGHSSLSVGAVPPRSRVPPREPSFSGFGAGTAIGLDAAAGGTGSSSLHAQGNFRQGGAAFGVLGPEASSSSAPGPSYLPSQPTAQGNPLRHSGTAAALQHNTPSTAAYRMDAFQAGVGMASDASIMQHQQAMLTPGTGSMGPPAAASASLLGRGTGGVTAYVQSLQPSHTSFTVERTALEARCRAAEEALSQSERRYAVDVDRLQSRVAALESGLVSERQLCGQLQQQLQADLKRLRAATEAEAAARAAEAAAKEMLAASNQSLELERRRAAEAAEQAGEAARTLNSRVAALEAERAGLEKQLLQEKDYASGLHKQLRDAQRQEQALMEKLGASEGARQQQELRLEAAAEHVTAMRNELQLLNAKLAARDKQLLKHVQEMEEVQLAALRSDLEAAQSRLQRQEGVYGALRASVAAIHQALGPQALAAAFGYSESLLVGFSASATEYGAVADRLMSQREVAEEDAVAVVARVKELVTQTRNLYMTSEKREVALTTEMDQAVNALRQTNAEVETRLASCNAALRTATQRVEELTLHAQESRNRCSELEGSLTSSQQARATERRRCEELQSSVVELQHEVARIGVRAAEADGAQRELSASREQALQLQQQVEQLSVLAQRSTEMAEAKEGRIRELRAALSSAMESNSAAEVQTVVMLAEKQQALEALDAVKKRCATLEAVVQSTEQQLEKVRSQADAMEASYRDLSQRVVSAAKDAVAHAREVKQDPEFAPWAPSAASPVSSDHLSRATQESKAQLHALESTLKRLACTAAVAAPAAVPDWGSSPGDPGPPDSLLQLSDHGLPQAVTLMLVGRIQLLSTQHSFTGRQLHAAHQALIRAVEAGVSASSADSQSPYRKIAGADGLVGVAAGRGITMAAAGSLPVHELAQVVATAAEDVLQVVEGSLDRERSVLQRLTAICTELDEARKEAALVPILQERLAACERELDHVKIKAQEEFSRVQDEVNRVFMEADTIREGALAEAESRIRAAEHRAADAVAQSLAQVAAAEQMAEARVRDAESARSASIALISALQDELSHTRSLLDASRSETTDIQDEQAVGLRHIAGLNEEIRRLGEEVTYWRRAAHPRTRERLLLLAKVRILRRKRTQLQERLAEDKHRAAQMSTALNARRERIKQGMAQVRQMHIDNMQLSSRLQEAEARIARADALLNRLEERRISLEQDRKAQAEKASRLASQLADTNKTLEAARKAEALVRKDMDRIVRDELEPQQRRTATMLEELERAAQALQESQANATRLLQQGEALGNELAELKRLAEEEKQRAQEQLAAVSKDVTERDVAITSLRQQVAAAQAAAAATAALLPAISSGQLQDAAAVQAHLIDQLGHMQATNAELESRRSAVETELEVLRVRLSRAEAAHTPFPVSGLPGPSLTAAQSLGHALADLTNNVNTSSMPLVAITLRDDASMGTRASYARDQDPVLTGAKDQRIHELRAALTAVMADRASLQRELAVAREEGSAEVEAQVAHVRMLEEEVQRLAASLETAEQQLEEVTASARQVVQAAEARAAERIEEAEAKTREEVEALEKRLREAERSAVEATSRGAERAKQADRAREQVGQVQALHASAEEAVRQLSTHLREVQQGSSSSAQVAAMEAQQLQATIDSVRMELAMAKDAAETNEAEVRRLTAQNDATASQALSLAQQLQRLGDDLAAARSRITTLQQEVEDGRAENDTLRRAHKALQASLSAAEERHADSEAQLMEAEEAMSREQVRVRQARAENEQLHERLLELQHQLQQLTLERRAAAAAATTAAAIAARSPSPRSTGTASTAACGPPIRREGSPLGSLESRLLEAAVSDLQVKVEGLQASLLAAETRSAQGEEDAQLLRTDLDTAQLRMRAAESKVAELQSRLEASLSGSAQGVNNLKEKVLELELHLDEQRDREQAAQAALARATERCNELQSALAEEERWAGELQLRFEDKELEVGVLQAQLASAAAQRLAQQAEAQQQVEAICGSDQAVASALEVQLREKTLLAEALQAEAKAAVSRAESAERELQRQRSLVERLRSDAKELDWQRQAASEEVQMSADAGTRLRAECSKLTEKLSRTQDELLEARDAYDKSAAQLRSAEARLTEEMSEAESLRRQLEAASSQGRGADLLWVQRVADLEQALAVARQQAADAEDAVEEAAAAQVRSAGLETRAQDLEAALAEAETRAAAAADAEARVAAALSSQREAHRQEVTARQLQVQGLQARLAVCEQQVADRDSRLEGVGKQLTALGGHTEAFEAQLQEVRQELRAALQENQALQRRLASADQEATGGHRRITQQTDVEASVVSGFSLSTTSHAPQQLVGMLTENRDLLEKLTATHLKLRQARSKLVQWEQEMRSKDLEVERLRAQATAMGGAATDGASMSSVSPDNVDNIIRVLHSELQAYKVALAASQEEAAASAAAAAEAQARCNALSLRLQQDSERHASHSHASSRAVEHSSPSLLERLHEQIRLTDGGAEDADIRSTLQALMQKVRAQRSEIESLTVELQAANAKRTELAKEAARLDCRLSETEIRERDFAATAETLRQQLELTQQQLESRQLMLQQLTAVSKQRQQQQEQQLTAGATRIVGLSGLPSQGEGAQNGLESAATSPRSQATRPYPATHVSLSHGHASLADLYPPGAAHPAVSTSYSSQHQLLLAQQHQQQSSKLDRVVSMWRDACRAKDARVQELQADMTTFSSQLERARADASTLTAKVLEREQALTSVQHQLDLMRDSLGAQLRAAEVKMGAKAQQLASVELELQTREEELRETRTQLLSAERSLLLVQANSGVQYEAASKSAADLAAAMRQVTALQAEVQELQQRSTAAHSGAQQINDQVQHLQEQLSGVDAVVGRLLVVVRAAVSTTTARRLSLSSGAGQSEGVAAEAAASSASGASLLPMSGALPTSLRLLEELISVLVEELQKRGAALVAAEGQVASYQSQLGAREEDVNRLEARLKSAQDALASRLDELSRLQTALRRKEADCEAVETEIAAQIADYQRLKQRLLQQERDSSRLSTDQEALLRRSDELEGALANKQEECALLLKKCTQLEEQLQAGRGAMAALQERVRSLDAQSVALQRNNQTATQARQDTAAALDGARAELRAALQQLAAYRELVEKKDRELRELNNMIQAWEAIRLSKDAQIGSLLERCKRQEEDAAEKVRTIEALRRKQQLSSGGGTTRASLSGFASAVGVSPANSTNTPVAMAQLQQQQLRNLGTQGTRHIHVHMHSPAVVSSPATSGMSGSGSNPGR